MVTGYRNQGINKEDSCCKRVCFTSQKISYTGCEGNYTFNEIKEICLNCCAPDFQCSLHTMPAKQEHTREAEAMGVSTGSVEKVRHQC
jgi:hypothetical protein